MKFDTRNDLSLETLKISIAEYDPGILKSLLSSSQLMPNSFQVSINSAFQFGSEDGNNI